MIQLSSTEFVVLLARSRFRYMSNLGFYNKTDLM